MLTARSSRRERRALLADVGPERRSWLANGLVALVISGLGLGVAGAVTLTGNAQSTDPLTAEAPRRSRVVAVPPVLTSPRPPTTVPDGAPPAVARAFLRREAAEAPSRSEELRSAIVQERAAQRAEDLSKTAEAVTRSARTRSSEAREVELEATDRGIKAAAVRLAEQRRRQAEAARLAAERALAEAEASLRVSAAAAADEAAPGPDSSSSSPPQPEPEPEPEPAPEPEKDNEPSPRKSETSSTGDEAPPPRDSGGSASPVPGAVIGSHFGQYGSWSRYHTGLDFRAGQGTPIKAVKSGVVLYAGNSGNWAGNHVAIKHSDGKTTMSSHMSSMAVSTGETVSAGDVIGYVGQTGRAFGAHLHFELYPAGVKYGDVYKAINPQPWLSDNGVDTR